MTVVALGFATEEFVSALCGSGIKTRLRRLWGRYSQLVELKSLQFRCDLIVIRADVLTIGESQIRETMGRRNGKLRSVI